MIGRRPNEFETERRIPEDFPMPKQKTHKGAAKRLKVSASGKVKMPRAGKSHLMSTNTPKSRRQLKRASYIQGKQAKTTRELLAPGRR